MLHRSESEATMTRQILGIALAVLVTLSSAAFADVASAKDSHAKKGHVQMHPIVFTKHYDKASPIL
jgi:type VI protein secretion system component Hcp